jgi:uncharacterized membrane protein (UPF0127 family)
MGLALLLAGGHLLAGDPAPVRFGRVITEGGTELAVEIARTPEQRARGYMFRDRVGPEDGMLFLFDEEAIHPFWMKNTKIPLDIIWIGGDGVVVFVAPGVQPCTADPCPEVLPMGRARSVLEVAAGRASALGVRPGTVLQLLLPPTPE